MTDYRRLDGTLSTTTEDEQSFQYPQTRPGTPQFSSPETPQAGDRAFIGSPHQTVSKFLIYKSKANTVLVQHFSMFLSFIKENH